MHGVTQYSFWLIVSSIVLLVIMFAFARRVSVVPHGRFANAIEYVIEYLENDVGIGILGKESWRRHMPFLGTLFLFILVNNIIGIIPGMKPGTAPFYHCGARPRCLHLLCLHRYEEPRSMGLY